MQEVGGGDEGEPLILSRKLAGATMQISRDGITRNIKTIKPLDTFRVWAVFLCLSKWARVKGLLAYGSGRGGGNLRQE